MGSKLVLKCTKCNALYEFEIERKLCERCGCGLTVETETPVAFMENIGGEGIWRYAQLFPYVDREFHYSLGEGGTCLIESTRLRRELGVKGLWFKNETTEPTGSYFDRSSALFVSFIKSLGYERIVTYSTGNLAASLAAYSSRIGIKLHVNVRPMVDVGKLYQMILYGAKVNVIQDFSKTRISMGEALAIEYDPIINEAKKTILLEVFLQLGGRLPEYIILPMGEGGLAYFTYKMLIELEKIFGDKGLKTKIVGVQPKGCAPIVEAYERGFNDVFSDTRFFTKIFDLSVSRPKYGCAALKAIRDTGGYAVSVSEEECYRALSLLAEMEGILAEPAASLSLAGLMKLRKSGEIGDDATVVCIVTGGGLKDPKIMKDIACKKSDASILLEELGGDVKMGKTKRAILELLSEEDMYGYQIWRSLREKYGLSMKIPSVYQHLSQLIEMGYVRKTFSKNVLGRKREYYSLTDKGRIAI
ncbi:MAG: pyridoxal-phosphate dependent enzyme [Nitrososphaeria archaeon]